MNRYNYRAIDDNGKYVTGKISAESPADLLAMLRSTRMELISYKKERSQRVSFFDKIKNRDLISMFIYLEQLNRAGVTIIDAISDLRENSDSSKIRNLVQELYESMKNGNLFSESLAKHPQIFNSVYVGLVSNGEKTGNLSQAFTSIIDDLKWNSELKRKTTKAISGPLFGIFIMCIVMAVMMGVVVPKVTGFLMTQSIELPFTTRALIAFTQFVTDYWPFLIFTIPLLILLTKILKNIPELRYQIDRIKLYLPVFGPIFTKIDSAKFCQFFAINFKSGLGVIECLESASLVLSNTAIKNSILNVRQQVSDGQSLAKSIANTGYFPALVVRMFKVGEDSGNMEEALQNIKFFYEREINDSIDRMVAMIQPALTLLMGLMIGWVTVAVFGPIYGSFSKVR